MRVFRSPLFWILCVAAVLRSAGIFWGLPASDGWDDDGVAPRNFLVGLALTYTPGSYFTYPPFHMFLIAIPTAPVWIAALFNAPSLAGHDVIAEMIRVPYMTFFAVVARVISVAMSMGTIFVVAKMTETVAGRRAGLFAAAACTLNAALTYYGQVTNLDGPYLFWAALSVWGWMRVIAEHEPRHMRWAALAAAAAVATKDQGYAIFLLSVPLALAIWFAFDEWPRRNARSVTLTALRWSGIALVALLLIDGAITNPAGFAERIAFLTGPASGNYAQYQDDWSGRMSLIADMWERFTRYYPHITIILAAAGIAIHVLRFRDDRARFVAGLFPLLAIISFTLAFNIPALRTETRFLLPQSIFIAVYIGIAAERFVFASRPWIKWSMRGFVLAVAVMAFYKCAGIVAEFIDDPRYDAERWLNAHVGKGDAIETYGLNVYLPRFPQGAVVTRVGPKSLKARNPLPNVTEVRQFYGAIAGRHPQFLVISGHWVQKFFRTDFAASHQGRVVPKSHRSEFEDLEARNYFNALFAGRLPYRLAHKAVYSPGIWPVSNTYESLAQTIFLFERMPLQPAKPVYKDKMRDSVRARLPGP
jgi:4-amino-4-deoxy-L-arabinose transferase-like glycosyltransferase